MSKYRAFIIGMGNIGYKYDQNNKYVQTHFKSIIRNKKIKLDGVADKNKKNLKKINNIHPHIKTFTTFEKPIKKLKPQIIVISTPTKTHFQIALKLIKLKFVKCLIIEKPCGENLSQLNKIVNLCRKNKKFLFINYYRLYLAPFLKLANKLKNKKKIFCKVKYNRGFMNNASHVIAFLSLFIKDEYKIKITKKNKLFKNEIQPSLKIDSKNVNIYFENYPSNNISILQCNIITKEYKLKSNMEFNVMFNKDKIIIHEEKNYQAKVLQKIITIMKQKNYEKFVNNYIFTSKLLDKVSNIYKKS